MMVVLIENLFLSVLILYLFVLTFYDFVAWRKKKKRKKNLIRRQIPATGSHLGRCELLMRQHLNKAPRAVLLSCYLMLLPSMSWPWKLARDLRWLKRNRNVTQARGIPGAVATGRRPLHDSHRQQAPKKWLAIFANYGFDISLTPAVGFDWWAHISLI